MLFSFDYTPYIAVIGDIKNSRQVERRDDVQRQLKNVLDAVNQTYRADIASNFMITLGDEFQGLLRRGASVPSIIDQIERSLYPVKLRFGLGIGEMTTDIFSAVPLGADGPAYYLARDSISELKAAERKKMEPKGNIKMKVQENPQASALMNTVFSLLATVKETWTARQVEIINAYLQNACKQVDTAEALGIHQPNVQQALAASNYYTYRYALDTLTDILSDVREDRRV